MTEILYKKLDSERTARVFDCEQCGLVFITDRVVAVKTTAMEKAGLKSFVSTCPRCNCVVRGFWI